MVSTFVLPTHFDRRPEVHINLQLSAVAEAPQSQSPLRCSSTQQPSFAEMAAKSDRRKLEDLLLKAAQTGRQRIVEQCIEKGVNVDVVLPAWGNKTALFYASEQGHTSTVGVLLKHVNLRTAHVPLENGLTPMLAAAKNGHADVVRLLEAAGANIETMGTDGCDPLHLAASRGHVDVVRHLLDKGANPNRNLGQGTTAILAASENGHHRVVDLLIKRRADLFLNRLRRKGHSTPAMVASTNGHQDVIATLLESTTHTAINSQRYDGNSALHGAARNNHPNIVRQLLRAGADVNLQNKQQETPLVCASLLGHAEIVSILLKQDTIRLDAAQLQKVLSNASAQRNLDIFILYIKSSKFRLDINQKVGRKGEETTLLCMAVTSENLQHLHILIDAGADVNKPDACRRSPLHHACHGGSTEIARLLVENGANINVGWGPLTPLHGATGREDLPIVEFLVKHPEIDVNATGNRELHAPLFLATLKGRLDIVETILQHPKVDVNLPSTPNGGDTPLIQASRSGRDDIVQPLLLHGALVNIKGKDGRTALHNASMHGHIETVKLLLTHDAHPGAKDSLGKTPRDIADPRDADIIDILSDHSHGTNANDTTEEVSCPKEKLHCAVDDPRVAFAHVSSPETSVGQNRSCAWAEVLRKSKIAVSSNMPKSWSATMRNFRMERSIIQDSENGQQITSSSTQFSHRLTPDEKSIVQQSGTVSVHGRSGTGKTTCIIHRIRHDRHQTKPDASFSQLFVAPSRRICDRVNDAVNDNGNEPLPLVKCISYRDLLIECEAKIPNMPTRSSPHRIDFSRFSADVYDAHEHKLDAIIVWTQMRSFIKGSVQALQLRRPLSRTECCTLGKTKQFRLNRDQCRRVHDAFQAYQQSRTALHWDDMDRVADMVQRLQAVGVLEHLRWSKLYVDEVQDYTQAELAMFFLLCSDRKGLFLVGDPVQSVFDCVDFRFEDVRSVARQLFGDNRNCIPSKPKSLTTNFRSHAGVLDLADGVLSLLFHAFPMSAKKLPVTQALGSGRRPGLLKNLTPSDLSDLVKKEEGVVILLRSEEAFSAIERIAGKEATILSIQEAKGLEFKTVVMVDFFKGLSDEQHAAWKRLLTERSAGDASTMHPEVEMHLKQLCTAITRCRERLLFAEMETAAAASTAAFDAFEKWAITRRRDSGRELMEAVTVDTMDTKLMTPEEFTAMGIQFAIRAEETTDLDQAKKEMGRAVRYFQRGQCDTLLQKALRHAKSIKLRNDNSDTRCNSDGTAATRKIALVHELIEAGQLLEARKLCECDFSLSTDNATSDEKHIRSAVLSLLRGVH